MIADTLLVQQRGSAPASHREPPLPARAGLGPVTAPNRAELTRLTHTIAHRVGRYLERQGLMERDAGNMFLTQEAVDASDEDPTNELLGSSVTYHIAVGMPGLLQKPMNERN